MPTDGHLLTKGFNGDVIMIKMLLTATFLLFTTPAFAESCVMKDRIIDEFLAAGTAKNAAKVRSLRDKGINFHQSGYHR